jgi:predicted Rossmann-fold nucleotide-binding protein
VFPGGFGTIDELFEVLTLRQTRKSPPIPIVLFDEAYWRSILNLEALVQAGMVGAEELALVRFAETPQAIWATLLEGGLRAGGEPAWPKAPDLVLPD